MAAVPGREPEEGGVAEPPSWLHRLTRAHPGELAPVLALFTYNFLVITTYLILKPVRYSLFLDRLGPGALPYAYIGTALFVGVAVWIYERLLKGLSRTGVVATTWSGLALGLVGFWLAFRGAEGVAASALFYFFSAVFGVVGVTIFWSFASEVFDPPQGRRLFGFIQAGAILGGLAGGALTARLAAPLGTENLLLVSAGLCVLCGVVGAGLSRAYPRDPASAAAPSATREEDAATRIREAAGGATLVAGSPYLRRVVLLIFGFQLASTLGDYVFQSAAHLAYPAKDARTAFFGDFYFWLGLGSLAVQICLTTRVHRRLGVGPALVVLPLVSAVGSGGFLLVPGFAAAVALRGSFGMLDYSLDRASRELLYLPTAPEVKTRAKAFVDMFCFRLFRSLAGVLILALGKGAEASLGAAAGLALVGAGGWLATALDLARAYRRQVREALLGEGSASEADLEPVPEEELDRAVRALVAAWDAGGDGREAEGALRELAERRHGPDLGRALEAAEDPARRALARELLDVTTPPGPARLLVRVLDSSRPRDQRLTLARRLAGA